MTATVADDPGGIGVSSTSLSAPVATGSVGSFFGAPFTASDQAGNDATPVSCAYEVEPPAISGQLAPPVDPLPALNKEKAGRVIPIKFRVVNALGAPVLGLVDPVVRTTNRACDATVLPDAVEEYVANSGFREHGDGWYQWNWATPSGYAGTCRTSRSSSRAPWSSPPTSRSSADPSPGHSHTAGARDLPAATPMRGARSTR